MSQIKSSQVNSFFDNPNSNRLVVSTEELAQMFGVSRSTIQRDMRRGLSEAAGCVVGGCWRFNVALAWEWWRTRGK